MTINDVVYQRMDLTLTKVDTGRLIPDQNILFLYCFSTPVKDNKTVNLLEDNRLLNYISIVSLSIFVSYILLMDVIYVLTAC